MALKYGFFIRVGVEHDSERTAIFVIKTSGFWTAA